MTRPILLLLLSISLSLSIDAQIYGDPVITVDFSDGIPSTWTQESLTGIAMWEYRGPNTEPNNNVGSRGSCAGSANVIQSESADNGFVIFDSNYWDDDGPSCGLNIGSGPDPGPHTNSLITESYDLTQYPPTSLTFQQHYKHYITQGIESTTSVWISVDGGENYEILIDNNSSGVTQNGLDEWASISLADYSGFTDVRFKFTFDGFYYFWMFDDFTIFIPSENDLLLESANYTTFEENLENNFIDMEYYTYPLVMMPEFNFRSTSRNIGGSPQTGTHLNVRITNESAETVYQANSEFSSQNPGSLVPYSVEDPAFPPAIPGEYEIRFRMNQDQEDQTPWNNEINKNYQIVSNQFGLDHNSMEDQFVPGGLYEMSPYSVGNIFATNRSDLIMHDICVAFGDSSSVGTEVVGKVEYFLNDSVVYGETEPYMLNEFDLNGIGGNFFVTLPLIEPFEVEQDTLYYISVASTPTETERMTVGRSGDAIPFVSTVNFEEPIFSGYFLKYPMIRMNLFEEESNPGCLDEVAVNYDPEADVDNGSCRYSGCTNPEATNYDPQANLEDGTCLIEGCPDPQADNYNPEANVEVDCIYFGCLDENANNFDPTANTDDGSCVYNEAFFTINDSTGCAPFSLTLYNQTTVVDGGICTWNITGMDPLLSCLDSVIVILDEPGMYDISYEYAVGEFATTYEIAGIEVFDVPEIPTLSYNTDTNVLTCTGCEQGDVQWFQEGEPIVPPTLNNWEPVDNAFYHVEVTNGNGCSAESEELYVLVVGIDELEANIAKAYPNPSNEMVQVESVSTVFNFELYDNLGQQVHQETVNNDQFRIDVTLLPNGVYHLRMLTRSGWNHLKIQVLH